MVAKSQYVPRTARNKASAIENSFYAGPERRPHLRLVDVSGYVFFAPPGKGLDTSLGNTSSLQGPFQACPGAISVED